MGCKCSRCGKEAEMQYVTKYTNGGENYYCSFECARKSKQLEYLTNQKCFGCGKPLSEAKEIVTEYLTGDTVHYCCMDCAFRHSYLERLDKNRN